MDPASLYGHATHLGPIPSDGWRISRLSDGDSDWEFVLRLVMMGTGPFAVPTFEALLESPHQVLALVTRPDRPVHDKHKQAAPRNPMREVAQRRQLEIFAPESINSAEEIQRLSDWRADL